MASESWFKFTWTIENFSALDTKKHFSDVFVVEGYRWRLLIFPKGNNVDQLSIYLEPADVAIQPFGWSKCADFSLSVVDQLYQNTIIKVTNHNFNARESDWGFTSFMPLSELRDSKCGFLMNDTLIVQVEILKHDHLKTESSSSVAVEKQVVHFRSLEKPKEDVFCLELWNLLRCNEVVQRVARHLGIHDPSRIRLTHHDWDAGEPASAPLKYRDMDLLKDMPVDSSKTFNIFYYEVLQDFMKWPDSSTTDQKKTSACSICWSEPKEGVCVPCGHVAACMSCLNKIQNKMYGCPVCRAKIQQVIRIFIA